MENLNWKTIPDWEWYQACPEGHIRRNPAYNIYKKKKPEDLVRTPLVNKKTGYCHTKLSRQGESRSFHIHRIIGLMFVPNPNGYKELDHINRDKQDNRAENLRWCTRRENMANISGKRALCSLLAFPPDGSEPIEFETMRDAAKWIAEQTGLVFFPQGICNVLNFPDRYPAYKGWKFKRLPAKD